MPITDKPTDADAVHTMRQRGDEFFRRIADAWLVADATRQKRLKQAFLPEFESYRTAAHYAKVEAQARAEAASAFDTHVGRVSILKPLDRHVADGLGRN
jgi:hypothetical protein